MTLEAVPAVDLAAAAETICALEVAARIDRFSPIAEAQAAAR